MSVQKSALRTSQGLNPISGVGSEMQGLQLGRGRKSSMIKTKMIGEDHDQIYQRASDRLTAIYKDPAHYVHGKANRSQATNTKQYKKRLVSKCTRPDRYHH